MKTQAKTLRNILKKHGITEASHGGKLSVRTERRYAGKHNGQSFYEWGDAIAHVRALTPIESAKLKEEKYIRVEEVFYGHLAEFAIVRY